MKDRNSASQRRSAREWARLVKAWEKSGRSVDDFAASRGVRPRTLAWWRWRLRSSGDTPPVAQDDLRLVSVHVAPETATAVTSPAWEIATSHGHVLRVYREIAPAELTTVLAALAAAGVSGGRP